MKNKKEQKTQAYSGINPSTELTHVNSVLKNKGNWQPVIESGVSRAVILFLIAAAILGIIIGRMAARFDEKAADTAPMSPIAIIESIYRSL